ncbi:beta-lactamase family protein [Acetobacterium wieringae]|uniref:Beta-lactamase family protein n=1 Tax=Acetobacterium wieringae TaxID=52694 RepID=A0ABY6HDK1_9FIRM|nr:serine hydrolase domain-containing protein [Acetobacterium wieringae]UYO62545.1 beta-lactamase family protein [Acetobacterium wieringae]VUZ23259.1 D-aminopeptidase [Acetobacterium wieringae]
MLKKRLTVVMLGLLLILVPLAGCTTAPSQSQSYEKTITTARTEIWKAIAGGGASSATVAIMDNGKIVYEEGFAMANRTEALGVNSSTQFNIGSVSKVFTAAAVMQLVEAGQLELDKPVVDYVPDFSMMDSRYKDITVRMLLNHTSGLPGTMMYNGFATAKDPQFLTEFMNYLAGSSLKADPGVVSVYCNDGFTLAEVLIEKVSGQTYSDYLQQNIFKKAGMNDSSCSFKAGNPNIALKYNNEDGTALPAEIINLMGTGGISATAVDLCHFGNALLENKLMSAESFTEYTSPQYGKETVPTGTPITNYGLGWDMVDVASFAEQGVHVLSKNGGTLQFNSQLYVIPEEKLSVALIFAGTGDASGIAETITQTLLEEKGVIPAPPPAEQTTTVAAIPGEILSFAGYYGASGSVIKIEFNQKNNTLEYKRFDGNGFTTAGSYSYSGEGYFDMQNGYRMSFSESFGKKLVLQSMNTADYSLVIGQGITANNPIDTSRFAGKAWIPKNLSAIDLYAFSAVTGSLPELPGTIYFGSDGSFTPYPLKDENTAYNNLPYARDLVEPTLKEENGTTTMTAMGYVFVDVADIPVLASDEKIRIEKNGENVVRKLAADGSFSVTLPEGGRLVIYDPALTVLADTMYAAIEDVPVPAGAYLMFIGNEGDEFAYQYSF